MNRKPYVLVVEDSAIDAKLARVLLELAGCDVDVVPDGEAALALIAGRKPDALVTDIHLPAMTGLELTAQLRTAAATRALPIVAVSASAGPTAEDRALAAGADAWCAKPLHPAAFPAIVLRCLGRP